MPPDRDRAGGVGGDDFEPGAGNETAEGVARREDAAQPSGALAAHGLPEKHNLKAALMRGDPKRVGGVAGRHVKDPRCLGCCHGMGQPKEKRETEKLRKKPAA